MIIWRTLLGYYLKIPELMSFREFLLHSIFFLYQPHPLLLILILKYGQHRMKTERFH